MREACGWSCPQKKKEGMEVWYGDEGEDQERTGGREKEQRTVHEDGECGTMSRTCEDRVLMGTMSLQLAVTIPPSARSVSARALALSRPTTSRAG